MRFHAFKPLIVVFCLLLALTYLWTESSSPELEKCRRWEETLRNIELRDAELMRDLLLARAGLLNNYDDLTHTGQALLELANSLADAIDPQASDHEQQLKPMALALSQALQQKLLLVEYFKSDNALLRNSVTYFNTLGKTQAGSKARQETARLWRIMLAFTESPDSDLAEDIRRELLRLAGIKPPKGDYEALVAHGGLIVDILLQLDENLREILALSVMEKLEVLQTGIGTYHATFETKASQHRLLLYLVAIALLGYWLQQFLSLKTKTESLRRAHATLQQETAERQQAEMALRESEGRLRSITESAHEAIITVDSQGQIVTWNHGASQMFGYSAAQMQGGTLLTLLPADTAFIREQLLSIELPSTEAATLPVELTGLRENGQAFPLELSFSHWQKGAEQFTTCIIRDISVRKRLEETARLQEQKLIQTNKLTALGTLVSGVAHEINNPNQLIMLNAGLLADAWADAADILGQHRSEHGEFCLGGLPFSEMEDAVPVLINDIKDGAGRIDRIVADLKNFARPKGDDVQLLFSLNEVVGWAVRLLNHLIGKKTNCLQIELAEPLALMRGNPQQIEQVVVNLLVNALDALADPGQGIVIKTYALPDCHQLCLEIRDQGCGIAADQLERLCDPFYTTKQSCGGTGLGLAITASLVEAHGGLISFESEPGKGTTVRVIFPVAAH